MKFKKKVEYVEAEQWTKGKKINGVIDDGPFRPSGSFMDRFNDHPDVYINTSQYGPKGVNEGDWVIIKNGKAVDAFSNDTFEKLYEPA